jgi:hypothetical protein
MVRDIPVLYLVAASESRLLSEYIGCGDHNDWFNFPSFTTPSGTDAIRCCRME